MDHVPPRQFYPREIRQKENINLKSAPSHKKCNENYRKDEEYFYHCLYPIVAKHSSDMGNVIFQDFARRCHKPQTPAMLRKVVKTASAITEGGIHLPSGMVELTVDEYRIQRVAAKIARGLVFLRTGTYFPEQSVIDMRFCLEESEAPEMYQLSWQAGSVEGVQPKVFSYKYLIFNGHHILSMLFWESFMYCVTLQSIEER